MPKRTSDHGKHNRTPLLGGLKDSMNALAADLGLSKPKKHDTNPFGDALQETSERKGGIIDELTRHAVALSPVIKRRTFPELENVPEGLVLGWAQLPSTRGRGFSLGIFPDRDHFCAGGVRRYAWPRIRGHRPQHGRAGYAGAIHVRQGKGSDSAGR